MQSENRLKVLFINHSVRDGGPGRSLFYILKYINRNLVEPFILIPKDDYFSEDLKAEGIYENVIVDRRFPENIQRPRVKLDTANNLTKRFKFIAQLAKIISIIINVFDLVSLVSDSPAVVKKNGIDIVYCNGTIAKITGAFIGRKTGADVIWHVRNIQQTFFLSFVIRNLAKFSCVKKIVCVSNATASQFEEVKEKVHVVYNGLDPSEFSKRGVKRQLREEYSLPPDTVVVGSTGRVVKRKGYAEFIKVASRIVKDESYKGRVRFVIVGDTPYFFPFNHLDELKELVHKLGTEDHFVFTGYKKDIKPYLMDFDVFVIPSNYPDPFPRSVIEAMSFSLPVVGFRIGGIAEAIDDGNSGYLCEKDGFGEMEESIKKLIDDKYLRDKMGKESRKRVTKLYSAKDRAKDIENIILELK